MKRKRILSFIAVILLLIIFAIVLYFINQRQGYRLEIEESKNCTGIPKLYLSEDTRNIYTYCIDSISVYHSNKKSDLSTYLKDNRLRIEDVIYRLSKKESYWDGGSILYRNNGNSMLSKSGISILKCHAVNIDGTNEDIYIGTKNMTYENNFCKTLTEEEKFYQNTPGTITPIQELTEDYTLQDAINQGACYLGNNNIFYHEEVYQQFLDDYKNKKDSFLRYIRTTAEGDMIIDDIKYDSKSDTIYILTDTTRDKFATESDRKITIHQFERLEEIVTNEGSGDFYKLSAFQGTEEYIIHSYSIFTN